MRLEKQQDPDRVAISTNGGVLRAWVTFKAMRGGFPTFRRKNP